MKKPVLLQCLIKTENQGWLPHCYQVVDDVKAVVAIGRYPGSTVRLSTLAIGVSNLVLCLTRLPINGDQTSLKRNWSLFNTLDLIFSGFIYSLVWQWRSFTRNDAVWSQNGMMCLNSL
jgi:hypothetical protein